MLDWIPLLDIAPLFTSNEAARGEVAEKIRAACREHGFFYITGHGLSPELAERLERLSAEFFAKPVDQKLQIAMERGGRAWRGYFRVGDELTSGQPDQKEGIYFGAELPAGHPEVQAGTAMHGPNLFPDFVPGFGEAILEYMEALTGIGHALMEGIALSLGLPASYFRERYTTEPLTLFRIFHYPAHTPGQWGVGEHTDYGLLTILRQDDVGGLEVKTPAGWIEAPPIEGSFVCNIGDMLDRMTGGFYRSTPHRVRNESGRSRLSFPFFFDPNFHARIEAIDPGAVVQDDERWDGARLHEFGGTYGEYILAKVGKVFPQLVREVL